MNLEIDPEPSEAERAAIVAALEAEAEDARSGWGNALLPRREESLEPDSNSTSPGAA